MPWFERASQQRVREHLRGEYVRGLTGEGCIGFHGTSIYALQYAIEHGVLPGATGRGERERPIDAVNGDLYFWKVGDSQDKYGAYNPIGESRSYARLTAQAHHLAELLGLRRDNRRHQISATEFLLDFEEYWQRYLDETGLTMSVEELENYVEEAEGKKGLVVGIALETERRYPIVDVSPLGDDGWRIETRGMGLPYTFIRGIQPIGAEAHAFIERL